MRSANRPGRPALRRSGLWLATALLWQLARAGSIGGDLALTSDYIFRGISQGNADPAAQADVHYTTTDGTYAGVFASTLTRWHGRGYRGEIEAYLGHRFDLSQAWSTAVTAVDYLYLSHNSPVSDDYQELSTSISYLDQWTLSVAAAPNVVRYDHRYRLGRYTAYVADLGAQLPIAGRLFATAGVGYYSLNGPEPDHYAYGNAGIAFEYGAWRLDAGYYVTQKHIQPLFPYGRAIDRFAGTVSWHF